MFMINDTRKYFIYDFIDDFDNNPYTPKCYNIQYTANKIK